MATLSIMLRAIFLIVPLVSLMLGINAFGKVSDKQEQLKLKTIQLEDQGEIKSELEQQQQELEKQLQYHVDKDQQDAKSIEELNSKVESLESQNQDLDAKLQAKEKRKSQLASSSTNVKYPSKGCESYRGLLSQYSGWNVDTMLYAMKKESGCNPNAVGDNYAIRGLHAVSCGLLQVRTLQGRPPCSELKNPEVNIAWAHKIWKSQSYRAWTTLH